MQFSRELRDDVLGGDITLSVRLWQRPQVKEGGRYRVGLGEIEIDAIELVPFSAITEEDVRRAGEPDRETLRERAAHAGPIDEDTLVYRIELHAVSPGTRVFSEMSMTRRDALKGAAGLAALGVRPPRSGRDRVAIIGGGAGGVAAAYFLAGSLDVDLFEARARIGGHCDSRVIRHGGQRLTVDLGAQFFHPETHPHLRDAAGGARPLRP